jgi:hypothetical protein
MIPDAKLDEWEKKLRENPEGSQPNWEYRGILKETISDLRRCRELLFKSEISLCQKEKTEYSVQLLSEIKEYRSAWIVPFIQWNQQVGNYVRFIK